MKYSVCTAGKQSVTNVASAQEERSFDQFTLLEATENLHQAWMDLTEAQRNMDEVCAVMENIHTAVDLINKFDKSAIPTLNVDGGLEALLQIPENVITAEKAMEGLGDAAKDAWEKVKGFIVRIFDSIKKYLQRKFSARFEYLRRVKALKKDIESKGSQSWSVDNKASQCTGCYIIKHSDYMDLLGKCDKIVEITQPVIMKVVEESKKVETAIASDKYVEWNNSMIKLVGDSIRSLSSPLASVGVFLNVSDDGIVHCYQKRTIKDMVNILTGKRYDDEYVSETDSFHPISAVDKESTLASAGWTYENAIKAADKLIEHYDRFGHFDEFIMNKTENVNGKFLSALNKIPQDDTERIKVLKGTFNSMISFYRICLMLQDYGFHYFLRCARDIAHAR